MELLSKRAAEIIDEHLEMDAPSYEDARKELGYTGYMEIYLQYSKITETMSTFADYNVMLELASIDQLWDKNITMID